MDVFYRSRPHNFSNVLPIPNFLISCESQPTVLSYFLFSLPGGVSVVHSLLDLLVYCSTVQNCSHCKHRGSHLRMTYLMMVLNFYYTMDLPSIVVKELRQQFTRRFFPTTPWVTTKKSAVSFFFLFWSWFCTIPLSVKGQKGHVSRFLNAAIISENHILNTIWKK